MDCDILISVPQKKLKRSRSLDTLADKHTNNVTKSLECDWEVQKDSLEGDDSGVDQSNDGFSHVERKIGKLSEVCMEQSRLLAEITAQVQNARDSAALSEDELIDLLSELLKKLIEQREERAGGCGAADSGARSLLSAIASRPPLPLDQRIGDTLDELLRSEELKERIVSATTASVKELINNLFSVEVSTLYLPMMQRSHRQLHKHVTKLLVAAFTDLEESLARNGEIQYRSSESLEQSMRQHEQLIREVTHADQKLLDTVTSTTEKVLERELKNWREDISTVISRSVSDSHLEFAESRSPSPAPTPDLDCSAPPSPADTHELSPIDRMMISAEVRKLIKDGLINEAFAKALLAMDLVLLAETCRAAPPAALHHLEQPVLLSLMQQLATDLLQDTQLKCTYLEQAFLHLNPANEVTRSHLPTVVADLCSHVTSFLAKYPHHVLAHTITAIGNTARNLL